MTTKPLKLAFNYVVTTERSPYGAIRTVHYKPEQGRTADLFGRDFEWANSSVLSLPLRDALSLIGVQLVDFATRNGQKDVDRSVEFIDSKGRRETVRTAAFIPH